MRTQEPCEGPVLALLATKEAWLTDEGCRMDNLETAALGPPAVTGRSLARATLDPLGVTGRSLVEGSPGAEWTEPGEGSPGPAWCDWKGPGEGGPGPARVCPAPSTSESVEQVLLET